MRHRHEAVVEEPAQASLADGYPFDVGRLIATRMAIQANSGGGKSRMLRRILEQAFGHCPELVLDPEGEFHTLREAFPFVLAGPGGEAPVDIESAGKLAHRILEENVSAIIDFSELAGTVKIKVDGREREVVAREEFLKRFLTGLMDAPRHLWHPLIVALDEAGKFCPENGQAESSSAVLHLMTAGRKRGFGAILATQRISTISKSALAECNNYLIGRTGLDVDIERASKMLGTKTETARKLLRRRKPGEFYGFGPAITGDEALVIDFRSGPVRTTHPEAGQVLPPTPPATDIKNRFADLAKVTAEARQEARTVDELRADNERLRLLLEGAKAWESSADRKAYADLKLAHDHLKTDHRALEESYKAVTVAATRAADAMGAHAQLLHRTLDEAAAARANARQLTIEIQPADSVTVTMRGTAPDPKDVPRSPLAFADVTGGEQAKLNRAMSRRSATSLNKLETAILTVLAQHAGGLTRAQILTHAAYARSGNTDKGFAKLLEHGFIKNHGDALVITNAGMEALGDWTPLPTGSALLDHLLRKFSTCEGRILQAVIGHYPGSVSRAVALNDADYQRSGNTDKAFAKLITLGYLVQTGRSHVKASDVFFVEREASK